MPMKLMTKEIEQKIPKLYETEEVPMEEKIVHVKFFCPVFTWYATEYCPTERLFFGYVVNERDPNCSEWGYFSLDELESLQKRPPNPFFFLDRDLYFDPTPASKIEGIQLY